MYNYMNVKWWGGGAQWILFLETNSIYIESKWRDHINNEFFNYNTFGHQMAIF